MEALPSWIKVDLSIFTPDDIRKLVPLGEYKSLPTSTLLKDYEYYSELVDRSYQRATLLPKDVFEYDFTYPSYLSMMLARALLSKEDATRDMLLSVAKNDKLVVSYIDSDDMNLFVHIATRLIDAPSIVAIVEMHKAKKLLKGDKKEKIKLMVNNLFNFISSEEHGQRILDIIRPYFSGEELEYLDKIVPDRIRQSVAIVTERFQKKK